MNYRPPMVTIGPATYEKMKKLGWIKNGRLDMEKIARDLQPKIEEAENED